VHLLTEQKIFIDCDAAMAFAFVADMEAFGRWFPGVLRINSTNALPPATVGKVYLETVALPDGTETAITLRVVEAVPNRRFVTEGDFPPLLPRMEVGFEAQGAGCTLTWRMLSRNQDPQVASTLPFVSRVLEERAALGMAQLKQLLEH
jgi:hypothetical protein